MKYITCVLALLFFCMGTGCNPTPIEEKDSPETMENIEHNKEAHFTDSVSITYLLGHFEPSEDEYFVKLSAPYAQGSALGGYLHSETYKAFQEMHEAALKEGISLIIISATRNFKRQKSIWEAKWNGEREVEGLNLALEIKEPETRALKILRYSSMPGTSRHHWGTDIDLNSLSNQYFEEGKGKILYEWMLKYAPSFGFCQPYTQKSFNQRTGYEEEKWHWSYVPLAQKYTLAYQTYVSHSDIEGFDGSEVAKKLNVIQNYVLGINQECLPHQ